MNEDEKEVFECLMEEKSGVWEEMDDGYIEQIYDEE